MILHPDGRVEGTPEEMAAYKLLLANDARQTLAAGGKVRLVEPEQFTTATTLHDMVHRPGQPNSAGVIGIVDNDVSTSVDRRDGGIVPRHVHDTIRLNALKEAIQRRKEAGIAAFPYEWQLEADELRSALDAYYGKEAPHWLKPCDSAPFKLESAETTEELTEEQVSSLSTYRLVEELSRRSDVRHIPILRTTKLSVKTENANTGITHHPEVLEHMKYILIERD